jgi:glucose/arabinose dehydrogenase
LSTRRAAVAATLIAFAATVLASVAPAQITSVRVASGLASPVFATAPVGDADRLFVLEQAGRIRLLKNNTLVTRPFLDITSIVNGGGEQGLLGLAFDPNFGTNRCFYVYYIAGTGSGQSTIARFEVSASDPDSAVAASRVSILSRPQPASNHNGGTIDFGPDGFLYFGFGDGGGQNDSNNLAQNLSQIFGKMIRIDPHGDDFPGDALNNYAVPPSNPFVGVGGALGEIWAYGLRNPYRWSFDRLTNDLYIGDVGQNCYEEISFQPGTSTVGENYGWRLAEGNHCFDPNDAFNCNQPQNCGAGTSPPIYEYSHVSGDGGCSVTGGSVYRGNAIPAIQGHYFFADYCSSQIYSFRKVGIGIQGFANRTTQLVPNVGSISSITCIGQDGVGELYIVDQGGEVFRINSDAATSVSPGLPQATRVEITPGFPNPFRDGTQFSLRLDESAHANVAVFSAAGRHIATLFEGTAPSGGLPLRWLGRDTQGRPLPAGVYFLRAEVGATTATKRMTLIR